VSFKSKLMHPMFIF